MPWVDVNRFGNSTLALVLGDLKTSNFKLQTPEKHQAPMPKNGCALETRVSPRLPALGAWFLELLWRLDVGAWCFCFPNDPTEIVGGSQGFVLS